MLCTYFILTVSVVFILWFRLGTVVVFCGCRDVTLVQNGWMDTYRRFGGFELLHGIGVPTNLLHGADTTFKHSNHLTRITLLATFDVPNFRTTTRRFE